MSWDDDHDRAADALHDEAELLADMARFAHFGDPERAAELRQRATDLVRLAAAIRAAGEADKGGGCECP
ncbi:hypothetical protein [Nocardioides ochotonae]|uniref:hypothetical protein n=1 Tax=Nocardioides ochotonae TaxID=2685869 RepID=UPI001408DDE0|nr:hypothetical protein [Nocardioides ochotonae]